MNELHHLNVILHLRKKTSQGRPIRVAFLVAFDSVFPGRNVMLEMAKEPLFKPCIVLIPDLLRGEENMKFQIKKSEESFRNLGIPIYKTYDEELNRFIDITDEFDLVCMSNPYEFLTHPLYTLRNISTKKALPFYIEYGYSVFNHSINVNTSLHMQNYWRIYLNNRNSHKEMKDRSGLDWKNSIFTGYAKMDSLLSASTNKKRKESKKVIIALHHTILPNKELNLGSFLEFSEAYKYLPGLFPGIEFVFRPHPLLFQKIDEVKALGNETAEQYFKSLVSQNKNCHMSSEADYFEIFTESDAMIHDCGSFTAEYLHTGKPVCFAKSKRTNFSNEMSTTGMGCINQHYIAENFEDIKYFLENVVLKEKDDLKKSRQNFFVKEFQVGAQIPSKVIINDIKKQLDMPN
jgi:hypothetical protein